MGGRGRSRGIRGRRPRERRMQGERLRGLGARRRPVAAAAAGAKRRGVRGERWPCAQGSDSPPQPSRRRALRRGEGCGEGRSGETHRPLPAGGRSPGGSPHAPRRAPCGAGRGGGRAWPAETDGHQQPAKRIAQQPRRGSGASARTLRGGSMPPPKRRTYYQSAKRRQRHYFSGAVRAPALDGRERA